MDGIYNKGVHNITNFYIKKTLLLFLMINTIIKYLFFSLHIICILLTNILWIFYSKILFLQLLVIISWYIFKNKCIITYYEYYFFKETIMGKNKKFHVPWYGRYSLYLEFILGLFYHNIAYYSFNYLLTFKDSINNSSNFLSIL